MRGQRWPSTYKAKVWETAGPPINGIRLRKGTVSSLELGEHNKYIYIYIHIQEDADERTPRIYDWLTGGRRRSVPGTSPWILNPTRGLTQNC